MSAIELGGARVAEAGGGAVCSGLRIRRLLAGELSGDELVQTEAHVAGCARCAAVRGEVERERAALAEAVPFDAFAAGVAEKLARAEGPVVRVAVRWQRLPRLAAAAAALLVAVGGASLLRSGGEVSSAPAVRAKGGPGLAVFALRASRSFALREGERIAPGDRLLPALEPGGRAFALVALAEAGEASLLYRGPARAGPLPEAFEWTGGAREARLVAVYSDSVLDSEVILGQLRAGSVAAGAGVEVVERRLER